MCMTVGESGGLGLVRTGGRSVAGMREQRSAGGESRGAGMRQRCGAVKIGERGAGTGLGKVWRGERAVVSECARLSQQEPEFP